MKTKTLKFAKFIIKIESNLTNKTIKTINVFDNRILQYKSDFYIVERNIKDFINVSDMKETLNWNLNGDSTKFQFKWGQRSKKYCEGVAYIFQ